ncbi:MAG: hypothetical protein EAZ19_01605 [Oscillatoriales cyanobacterium]|nr:MAG: hypothetical protein EAZ88_11140 [Oscillatoriales cyanobacterium]TAE68429.1 MAG: hypothetical protein EAZ86_13670 [Oscillatoriales cyanobacterium]TAF91899.1 MAG: hypothetical protein EAZ49_03765 [Oscillatoriales cyanobacterium]TAF97254.1 MAG: hypothetical protein EAZ45_22180 [Oscillatoriales cyanobacterium]TAG21840.1 MAG: hypothetical protein EAZ39_03980 [Oscillatoriales cyanobacterium]
MVKTQPGSKIKSIVMFSNETIHIVGIGHCHDSKWAQRQSKTTTVASVDEASRITAASAR